MTPLWVHCERDHSVAHLQSLPRCLFGSPCGSLLCECPQPPPLCSLVLLCLTALWLSCFEGLKSQVIFQMYLLVFMQGAEFFSKIPPSPLSLPPPLSLCVYVCLHAVAMVLMWRSEGNLKASALTFHNATGPLLPHRGSCQAGQPLSSWGLPCLHLLSLC